MINIASEVILPQGENHITAKVIARKRDADGAPVGKRNINPILDTCVYKVQFPDGHTEEYAANIIAESLYSTVNDEGNTYFIMKDIVGHKSTCAAFVGDEQYIICKNRQKKLRMSTQGWKLCIEWKDGSTTWDPFKDPKESNSIEVSEYAVANKIDHEPAFVWWVPNTLHKRNRIIKAVK